MRNGDYFNTTGECTYQTFVVNRQMGKYIVCAQFSFRLCGSLGLIDGIADMFKLFICLLLSLLYFSVFFIFFLNFILNIYIYIFFLFLRFFELKELKFNQKAFDCFILFSPKKTFFFTLSYHKLFVFTLVEQDQLSPIVRVISQLIPTI